MDAFDGPTSDRDTVLDVIDPVQRYARAHTGSESDADDVVQETLTRLLERQVSLTADSLLAYALVVARNVITDQHRETARTGRRADVSLDLRVVDTPEDLTVSAERDHALRVALADVSVGQREALLAHVLDERSLEAIAAAGETTRGSVGAQLARTRARLRLDYLLAVRRVDLPTGRCRPVLMALSAGDGRRQKALRAGQHLLACRTCSTLSEPLLERRHALAGVVPWLGYGVLLDQLRRILRPSPAHVVMLSGVVLVAGTAVTTAVVVHDDVTPGGPAAVTRPVVASAAPIDLTLTGSELPARDQLARSVGRPVTATSVPVLAVPADEGFWIGTAGHQIWIQMLTAGGESRVTVEPGDLVSFVGRVAPQDDHFAVDSGVSDAEGAQTLSRDGVHISVPVQDLRID